MSFHASPGISWPELIGAGREPRTRQGRESSERTLLFLHWATAKGRVRESGECPELFSLCSVFPPVVSCPGPQGVCGREAVGQAPGTSKSEKLLSNQKNCGPKNAGAPPWLFPHSDLFLAIWSWRQTGAGRAWQSQELRPRLCGHGRGKENRSLGRWEEEGTQESDP